MNSNDPILQLLDAREAQLTAEQTVAQRDLAQADADLTAAYRDRDRLAAQYAGAQVREQASQARARRSLQHAVLSNAGTLAATTVLGGLIAGRRGASLTGAATTVLLSVGITRIIRAQPTR